MSKTANSTLDLPADQDFVCGQSQTIQSLNAIVGQIASTEIAVLLVGESGTGKEAYARLIHRLSAHGRLPLKKVNCAVSEPGQLLPQIKDWVQAPPEDSRHGSGTLFLDGVDELDPTGQKLLLSLLRDGGTGEVSQTGLRVISSASQRLDGEVASGRFRRELYFRINGVCLHLPPLRERKQDIAAFMAYFLTKHASELGQVVPTLGNDELELLASYGWPGNIRELGNLARKIVALGSSKVALADLDTRPGTLSHSAKAYETISLKAAARAASRQVERQLILKALERTHWNRKRAAQELQISYKSLLYKIRQTGVEETKASER